MLRTEARPASGAGVLHAGVFDTGVIIRLDWQTCSWLDGPEPSWWDFTLLVQNSDMIRAAAVCDADTHQAYAAAGRYVKH